MANGPGMDILGEIESARSLLLEFGVKFVIRSERLKPELLKIEVLKPL
jgi:hypothetical protein